MRTLFILLLFVHTVSSCNGQSQARRTVAIGNTVSSLSKSIFIIYQARNNVYWFGSDADGVYRYNGKTLTHFSTKDGLPNNRIRQIQEDSSGNIFFATLGGICKYDGQRFTTLPAVETNDWQLQPNDLWFVSNQDDNGTFRYDGKTLYHLKFPKHYMEDEFYERLPNPPYNPYQVYTTYKDRVGNIWFGTSTFGIFRYDGKALSWLYEYHLTRIGDNGSFGIRSIIEDKAGKFWFCNTNYKYNIEPGYSTHNDSVLINHKREPGIGKFKAPDGSDVLYYLSVADDNNGNLWMATFDDGIWRYDGKNLTRYLFQEDGKDVTAYSVYKDKHGTLWVGTHQSGVYKFNGNGFAQFKP